MLIFLVMLNPLMWERGSSHQMLAEDETPRPTTVDASAYSFAFCTVTRNTFLVLPEVDTMHLLGTDYLKICTSAPSAWS